MIRLITSFYLDRNPDRQAELETCIRRNLENTDIHEIHLLCEGADALNRAKDLQMFAKTRSYVYDMARPSFQDFFNFANQIIQSDIDITIISNTDIYFGHDVSNLPKLLNARTCIALSRYDQVGEQLIPHHNPDTQDAWIFMGRIKPVRFANFYMGKPGCDNRIAYELARVGYAVINPVFDIQAVHLHESGVRNYTRTKSDTVPPPYKMVPPFEHSALRPDFMPQREITDSLEPYPREEWAMKKVLHVGFFMPSLNRAFQAVTDAYHFIEWKKYSPKELDAEIRRQFTRIRPDFVFVQIQTPDIIGEEVITWMREQGAFVVNWTGDVRHPVPKWYKDLAPAFNVTLFSNLHDIAELEKEGHKADYFQIGFEDDIYRMNGGVTASPQIVFMGNNYPKTFPLSDFRSTMVDFLTRHFGRQFGVFGQGWRRAIGNLNDNPGKEAGIYRRCEIAISVSHYNYGRYFSDRLLRAMGSGAFVLSHHYEGIEKDFTPGVHLDTFHDLQELLRKIQHYRRNPEQRKRIAAEGSRYVHDNCTWQVRLQQLQAIINKWR